MTKCVHSLFDTGVIRVSHTVISKHQTYFISRLRFASSAAVLSLIEVKNEMNILEQDFKAKTV